MTWLGVHPIIALLFMAIGGFITSLSAWVVIAIRERKTYSPRSGRHRRGNTA